MKFLKLFLILILVLMLIFGLNLVCNRAKLDAKEITTLNDITFKQRTMLILNEDLSAVLGNQKINFKVVLFFPEMRFCMFPYQITRVQ